MPGELLLEDAESVLELAQVVQVLRMASPDLALADNPEEPSLGRVVVQTIRWRPM
jgi:hypothetical protein